MATKSQSGSSLESDPSRLPRTVKLVLLGESAVGKTSIVLRLVKGTYTENLESTIGAAYLTQMVNHNGFVYKFDVWDTAGQERYHSLAPMYYRGAEVAIVVYDITAQESFERAKSWVKELRRQSSTNPIISLVANKIDLGNIRAVSKEEGEAYAEAEGLIFMETSAKMGTNVMDLFYLIAQQLPKPSATASSASSAGLNINQQDNRRNCC